MKDCKDEHKSKQEMLYKVVGRISQLANWVKAGDEFNKDEVKEYGICCSPDLEHGIAHHGNCGECLGYISGFMIKGSDGKFY